VKTFLVRGTFRWRSGPFGEGKEGGADKAAEGGDMIPADGLAEMLR
jgi:hypothetical protein